jgi:hypothetical protein
MAHSHGQALGRKRVALFGMHFDAVRLDEAVAEILGWSAEGVDKRFEANCTRLKGWSWPMTLVTRPRQT